jgi:integrase
MNWRWEGTVPRVVKEVSLTSRAARSRLAPRTKPYYRRLVGNLCLGYYRPATKGIAGSWVGRRYLADRKKYETATFGFADDRPEVPADGVQILTFDQAETRARQWLRAKLAPTPTEPVAATTVKGAVATYIAERKRRHPKAGRDAELRLAHHVLASPLADVALPALSEGALEKWRAEIKRGGRGAKSNSAPLTAGTLARLLNDLRAALSLAARRAKVGSEIFLAIRDGLKSPQQPDRARPKQILDDVDVGKLIDAASKIDADFAALVMVLAATGGRLSQVARICVSDVQIEARRVMLPTSKKGRGSKQIDFTAVPLDDGVVARLAQLAAGRPGHEPLLLHWRHAQVAGNKAKGALPRWEPVERRAWSDASGMARSWRAAVAAAGLSVDLVPYALRHSSIVRGLRAGLPAQLVASVHDTSVGMISKHYGAFIVDASQDLLRRATLPLAPATVTPDPAVPSD